MNSKSIAFTVTFAAIAIVLSRIVVPAPYLPILFYEIWEIPIVSLLFLVGIKPSFVALVLETAVALAFFPSLSYPGLNPVFSLVACSSMLLGAYVGLKIVKEYSYVKNFGALKMLVTSGLAIVFRILSMTALIYATYVGLLGAPSEAIFATFPLVGIFNLTLPLYTIPIGYLVAGIISRTQNFDRVTLNSRS